MQTTSTWPHSNNVVWLIVSRIRIVISLLVTVEVFYSRFVVVEMSLDRVSYVYFQLYCYNKPVFASGITSLILQLTSKLAVNIRRFFKIKIFLNTHE